MVELTMNEMARLPHGGEPLRTTCGVAVGVTIGATAMWGLTGFLLTFNKAVTVCSLAAAL